MAPRRSSTRRSRIRLTGFKECAEKLEAMARAAGEPNASGTRILAEHIKTLSNASAPGQGVPVLTGALRGSGRAEGPDNRGTSRVSYGGAAAPYALRQHEDLSLKHRIGEPRWLIRALERVVANGNAVKEALAYQARAVIAAGKAAGGRAR